MALKGLEMEGQAGVWCLTGRRSQNESVEDVEICVTPFQVGRRKDLSLSLANAAVSNVHAEFRVESRSLTVRDLNSTNGTFVNGVRISCETPLQPGDMVQFADVALRVQLRTVAPQEPLPVAAPAPRSQFESLLLTRSIVPHYQPIVSLRDQQLVGNEVLARSSFEGLRTPEEMFLAACERNLEEELSRMLRLASLEQCLRLSQTTRLFLNTHPSEISSQGLLNSLRTLREVNRHAQMTFEIREPDSADTLRLKQLRDAMSELGIGLAYDRFGSGRTQQLELAAIRPEYVKFDMDLIRDIHLAPKAQRTLLANLIRMVHDLGISSVAMGVESEAEHAVCFDIGFEYGQGFYYGKPVTSVDSGNETLAASAIS